MKPLTTLCPRCLLHLLLYDDRRDDAMLELRRRVAAIEKEATE